MIIIIINQTCQLSLIQPETQAISPSKTRLHSEKIAPISTSFMYVIIEQKIATCNDYCVGPYFQTQLESIYLTQSIASSEVGRSDHNLLYT